RTWWTISILSGDRWPYWRCLPARPAGTTASAAEARGSFRREGAMMVVGMEIDVLIPAYNESGYIGRTIAALRKLPQVKRILVIDDGSTDGTAAEAAAAGAEVFRLPRNGGKGAAVLYGARFARAPYLALVDADLGESAVELERLLPPLLEKRAE